MPIIESHAFFRNPFPGYVLGTFICYEMYERIDLKFFVFSLHEWKP